MEEDDLYLSLMFARKGLNGGESAAGDVMVDETGSKQTISQCSSRGMEDIFREPVLIHSLSPSIDF